MNCINCTYGRLYETVLIMSRVVVSFVSLKYFETDLVLIMKLYSCVSEFFSALELKHELDSSYIDVKVNASSFGTL